jgi:hypothetical protein
MTDQTIIDEIVIHIESLCRLQPEHELISYLDAACNPSVPHDHLTAAFVARFNPDGSNNKTTVLQAYSEAIEQAIAEFHLAIDQETAKCVDDWLAAIVVSHSM